MRKLAVTWKDGVHDATGYLFSFAKSLGTALKHSPFSEHAESTIATSGFAFRMWVSKDLCPSATSIWDFGSQKRWVESGGIACEYVGRYWGQEDVVEQRRTEAIDLIIKSIDNGIPAISWEVGVAEWGLITGYSDEDSMLFGLSVTGAEVEIPYASLGKQEIPILSVLTVTGPTGKARDDILRDTLRLAATHLRGEEWCGNNVGGLAAYPALIYHFEEGFNPDAAWNHRYFLGTYAPLKEYAARYFAAQGLDALSGMYGQVFSEWECAFRKAATEDIKSEGALRSIADALRRAHAIEKDALSEMERLLAAV